MKLVSWNVNGIRSAIAKGFDEFVGNADADVICLQETKARPEQVDFDSASTTWPTEYHRYWNSALKPGYAGTALFTRTQPIAVTYGLGVDEHDREGRVINAEFDTYYIVNVYTPNSQRGLARLDYRTLHWDSAFLKHVKKLERRKPVVFCGDLNVAHKEIDLANPKNNLRNAGFTAEERSAFERLLKAGYLDSFREFDMSPGRYTWWSFRFDARTRNIGWRIDYVCVSNRLRPRLKEAFIWPQVDGSDHCPVGVVLE